MAHQPVFTDLLEERLLRSQPKSVLQKSISGVPDEPSLGAQGGDFRSHRMTVAQREAFRAEASRHFDKKSALIDQLVDLFDQEGKHLSKRGDVRIDLLADPKAFEESLKSTANDLEMFGVWYGQQLEILKEVIVDQVFAKIIARNDAFERHFVSQTELEQFRAELPELIFGRHSSKFDGPLVDIGLKRAESERFYTIDHSTPATDEAILKQKKISHHLLAGAYQRVVGDRAPMETDPAPLFKAIKSYKDNLKHRATNSFADVRVLAKLQDLMAKGFNPSHGGVGHFPKKSDPNADFNAWKFTPLKESEDLNSPHNRRAFEVLERQIDYYEQGAESYGRGNAIERDMPGIQIYATVGQIYNDILTDPDLPAKERSDLLEELKKEGVIRTMEAPDANSKPADPVTELHQGIRGHPLLMEFRLQPITDRMAPKILESYGIKPNPLAEEVLSRALRRSPGTNLDGLAGLRGRMPDADKDYARIMTGRFKASQHVMNMPDAQLDEAALQESLDKLIHRDQPASGSWSSAPEETRTQDFRGTLERALHHAERPIAIQRETILPPHIDAFCKTSDGFTRAKILIAAVNAEWNELQLLISRTSSRIAEINHRLRLLPSDDSNRGSLESELASLKEGSEAITKELAVVEDLHWKFALSHPEHVNLAPYPRGMQEKILQSLGKLEFGSIVVQDLQGRSHTLGKLAGQRSVAGLIHDKGLRTLCSISGTTTDIALALVLTHGEGKVKEWSEALLKVADGKLDPEDLPVAFHDFLSTVGLFMQGGEYHTVPEVLGGMLVVAEALERQQSAAGAFSIDEGRSLNRLQRLLGILAERPRVLLSAEGKSTEAQRESVPQPLPSDVLLSGEGESIKAEGDAVSQPTQSGPQHDAGTGRGIRWGDQSAVRRQDPRSEKLIRDLEKAKTAADRKRVLADFQRTDQSLWKDFIDLGKGEISAVKEGIGFNEKLADLRDGGHLQDPGLEKTEQAMGEAAALLGVAKYALGISKAKKKKKVLSWSLQEAKEKLDAFQKVEGNKLQIERIRKNRQADLTKVRDAFANLQLNAPVADRLKGLRMRLQQLETVSQKPGSSIKGKLDRLGTSLSALEQQFRQLESNSSSDSLLNEINTVENELNGLRADYEKDQEKRADIENRFLEVYDRLKPHEEALRKEIEDLKFKSQDNNFKLYVRYPAGVASSTFSLATPLTAGVAHTAVSASGGFLGLFGGISAFFSARRTHRARKEWQRLRQEIKDLDREIHTLKSAGRRISQEDADRLTLLESTRSQLSQQRKDERRQFFGEMFSAIAGTASFVSGALGLVALSFGSAPLLLAIASGLALVGIGCGLIGAGVLIGDALAKRKRDEHRQNKMAEFQSAMARFEEFEKTHETEAPKSADRYDWNSYYAPLIRDLSKDHPRIRKMFEGGSRYNYFRKTGLDPVDIKDACRKYLEKRFINATAERTYHNLERELRALSMVMSGYESGKDGYPPPPHQGGNGQNPLPAKTSPSEKYFQDADDAVGGHRFNRQFPTLATLRDLSSVGSNGLSEIHWCGGAKDGMKMLVSKLGGKLIQTESVMEKDYLKSAGSDAIHLQTAATGVHSNLYNSGKAGLLLLMKKHPRFWSENAHLPEDLREKIKEFQQRPSHTGSQMSHLYEAMESQWPHDELVRLEDPAELLESGLSESRDRFQSYHQMFSLNHDFKKFYERIGLMKKVENPITQKSEKVYDLAKSVSLERGNSLNPQEPYYAVIGRYDSSGVADHSQLVDPLGEIQSGINRIEPSVIICNRGSMMSRPDHVTYERRPDGAWDVVEGSQRTYLGDLTMEGILKGMQDADPKKRARWIQVARDLRENSVVVGYGSEAGSQIIDRARDEDDFHTDPFEDEDDFSIVIEEGASSENLGSTSSFSASLSSPHVSSSSNPNAPAQVVEQSGALPAGPDLQTMSNLTYKVFGSESDRGKVQNGIWNNLSEEQKTNLGFAKDYVHVPVEAGGYCLLTALASAKNMSTSELVKKIEDTLRLPGNEGLKTKWEAEKLKSRGQSGYDIGSSGLDPYELTEVWKAVGIEFNIVVLQDRNYVMQPLDFSTDLDERKPTLFYSKSYNTGHFDLLIPKNVAITNKVPHDGSQYIAKK